MENTYSVVLTTCPNESEANRIIKAILENKLAACIQTFPINSHYIWEDKVCNENEIALLIKCNNNHYNELEKTILANHSYEVPEIILLQIKNGFSKYLGWIDEVSK